MLRQYKNFYCRSIYLNTAAAFLTELRNIKL